MLLPTCDRPISFVTTLAGICGQTLAPARVVVADQSHAPIMREPVTKSLFRMLESRGVIVDYHHRAQIHGIAEQRQFLLDQADAPLVLYLDDDVFMESWVLARLTETITAEGCGFVGAFPTGLSFRDDLRPHQEYIEFWDGRVTPEVVEPEGPKWRRAQLHRAANAWHVSRQLRPGEHRLYKVAWVASCVLYDRQKLLNVGGFAFWPQLPRYHSGEEVLVQNLLLRHFGGCSILPSGTYHSELPSTVLNANGGIDGHALDLLPELTERFA